MVLQPPTKTSASAFDKLNAFRALDFVLETALLARPASIVMASNAIALVLGNIYWDLPWIEHPASGALGWESPSPRLYISMSPHIFAGGRVGDMNHICLLSQGVAMDPEGFLEGAVKTKPMNNNVLGNVLHQIHSTQGGKPLCIKCESISNT